MTPEAYAPDIVEEPYNGDPYDPTGVPGDPVSGDPYHADPAVRAAVNPTSAPIAARSERDDAGALPAQTAGDNLPAFDPSAEPGSVTGLGLADYRRIGQKVGDVTSRLGSETTVGRAATHPIDTSAQEDATRRFLDDPVGTTWNALKSAATHPIDTAPFEKLSTTLSDYKEGKITAEQAQQQTFEIAQLAMGVGGAEAGLGESTLTAGMRRGRYGRTPGYTQEGEVAEGPPAAGHNLPTSNQPLPTLPEDAPLYHQGVEALKATPLDMHPHEQELNVNSIMHPDTPALPPRSRGVTEIAKELDQRGQDALTAMGVPGGKITDPNDEFTNELLARQMAQEANAALARPGANASDWYTGQVKKGMDLAAQMYPEIGTDAEARTAFQTALAVTSQGETVGNNTRLATQAYEYWRDHGRTFPTDLKAAGFDTKHAPAMEGNFDKYNQLVKAHGADAAREFLNEDFRAGDLAKMGYGDIDENVNTTVKGSSIFGPKIGGGFFQNLGGNYDPVTMDLWFMRHWGRQTGTLVGNPDTGKQYFRFLSAMHDPSFAEQMAGRAIPDTEEATLDLADQLRLEHERSYRMNRGDYEADPSLKTELTHSAIAYQNASEGINEQPRSGGQRQHIRSVVNRGREILEQEYGHQLSNADLQAVLWYPEKDLYAKLGGRPTADLNTDYASSLAELAKVKGIPDDVIQSILRSSHRGSGPANEAAQPGGNAPLRQGGGGAAGQAPQGARAGAPEANPAELYPLGPQASIEPVNGDPFAYG